MDDAENPPSPSSRASSNSEYHPVDDASAYARLEEDRRQHNVGKGNLMTGCKELDDYVLLGGFERGSIVGVSAEGEEMGLIIGLQILARLLAKDTSAKATVVTTMPTTALLPKLRTALVGQICPLPGRPNVLRDRVRLCFERISIARVFDLEGVAEVIEELERSHYIPYPRPPRDSRGAKVAEEKPDHAALEKEAIQQQQQQDKHWTEVQDSEDEDEESLPCGQSTSEKPSPEHQAPVSGDPGSRPLPDMVLVTHMSTMMSTLFTSRGKEFAHSFMDLLSDQLHCLTRYSEHSPPLIMLLNSTSSPSSAYHHSNEHPTAMPADRDYRSQKQLDSTLRSIFNPPRPPSVTSIPGQEQSEQNLNNFASSSNRNKPSFGLVFSQMLDLHLLCGRIPRTRADAAALRAVSSSSPRGTTIAEDRVSYVWAVEVLLDEIGVYERSWVDGSCDWTRRTNREQRWAAVDVDRDGKVVNAFAS